MSTNTKSKKSATEFGQTDLLEEVKEYWDEYQRNGGLSQVKLAASIGYRQGTLSQYLLGHIRLNSAFLAKLLPAIGHSLSDLKHADVLKRGKIEVSPMIQSPMDVKLSTFGDEIRDTSIFVAPTPSNSYLIAVSSDCPIFPKGSLLIANEKGDIYDGSLVVWYDTESENLERTIVGKIYNDLGKWMVCPLQIAFGERFEIPKNSVVHPIVGWTSQKIDKDAARVFKRL